MKTALFILLLWLVSCMSSVPVPEQASEDLQFSAEQKVRIAGYGGDVMEPFVSRDGKWLFFNNRNDPATNTNIFYAERVNDTLFLFKGELPGVNSPSLDGVPTMDSAGHFYFVSTRSYDQTSSVIYRGKFIDGNVTDVEICPGISTRQPGTVNFDVEVSSDGNTLYFVDSKFDASHQPQSADLVIAGRSGNSFQRIANSAAILHTINTSQLEYAAGISADELTLYFTRVAAITSHAMPRIFYATRHSKEEPFGQPQEIKEATGFVEGPSEPVNGLLYFHKRENDHFVLYCLRKKG